MLSQFSKAAHHHSAMEKFIRASIFIVMLCSLWLMFPTDGAAGSGNAITYHNLIQSDLGRSRDNRGYYRDRLRVCHISQNRQLPSQLHSEPGVDADNG